MTSSRVVSVFGATGLQGGAVVDALLKEGTFIPRAITRDPGSEASQKLRARGVEVVRADSTDKASLVTALRGSEAVFAVTVPVFRQTQGKGEVEQGKNMVDAAKEVGVKFFIWTSLPSLSKISGGKYKNASHFEDKHVVQEYLKSSGLAHASLLLPGFLENYWKLGILKKTDTGYTISVPICNATTIAAYAWISRDVPAAVLTLLNNYTDPTKEIKGKEYPVVNASILYGKLAEMTAKGTHFDTDLERVYSIPVPDAHTNHPTVLDVEVTFITAPPTGVPALDDMARPPCYPTIHWMGVLEYGPWYKETPIPNPDLVALGMKFSTIEEFLETEVKPRFGV
ncbi:NmrA domain-containing protein [Mycena sanguinolenta]|uniref:NmrA domain-containing protein n=1 Tax=Mycena sanguinolenta TaxID=230812 RepID=A0A8H6YLW3_9AGAR|nr:NmrA domain-containing protein [Mycena sanguinolenta]